MHEDNPNPLGREYTKAEWAAARRVGLAPEPARGVLISATLPYWPNEVRQKANDYALVADALEREWHKTGSFAR